jgi:Ran GTPase-activating protein (RanGAP) involved in mRNA processing and transport
MIYRINTEFKKYETIESAQQLLEELNSNAAEITSLDLSMNTYTLVVIKEICKIIGCMYQLKSVRLESILDSLPYEEMCQVLSAISNALPRTLHSLEMPSNALSCKFPVDFGKFLAECPLYSLSLYDCGLGQEGLLRISEYLDKLPDKSKLSDLDISKNRINVIEKQFAETFNSFENIRSLKIRHNTIEEVSLGNFLKRIKSKKIDVLDLSDNFVVGEAIDVLGELFLKSDIKELYLHDSKMDTEELIRLLKVLSSKKIQELPGALSSTKPNLVLDLSCIDFEQDAVKHLEQLAEVYRLEKLTIFDNSYDDISKLRQIIEADEGKIIEEEQDNRMEVDDDILERLKGV